MTRSTRTARGHLLLVATAATALFAGWASPSDGGGVDIPGIGHDSVHCAAGPSDPRAHDSCNHQGHDGHDGAPGAVHGDPSRAHHRSDRSDSDRSDSDSPE